MGTTVTVRPLAASHLVKEVFEQTELELSEWKENSPLSLINKRSGKKSVQVSDDLFHTLQRSLEIAKLTSGAFDPTWASLWELWKFDEYHSVPSQEQVDALLGDVNWKNILLNVDERSVFLTQGSIGLGGIAKGVALDKSRDVLLEHGFQSFMIVVGGQVLVEGLNDEKLWKVGIRNPDKSQSDYFAILKLSNTCVSTSGNYEKFFIKDGVRYHHIIDTKTGFPSEGMKSVTVISEDATLADALSTALFVMGPEKGLQCVNHLQQTEAMMIDSDNDVFFSSNFEQFLSNSHSVQGIASSNLITASHE